MACCILLLSGCISYCLWSHVSQEFERRRFCAFFCLSVRPLVPLFALCSLSVVRRDNKIMFSVHIRHTIIYYIYSNNNNFYVLYILYLKCPWGPLVFFYFQRKWILIPDFLIEKCESRSESAQKKVPDGRIWKPKCAPFVVYCISLHGNRMNDLQLSNGESSMEFFIWGHLFRVHFELENF